MKDSIRQRLEEVRRRHEEVGALLADPEVVQDQPRFRDLSREYARLEPIIATWNRWRDAERAEAEARAMASEDDPDLRAMAEEEARRQTEARTALGGELQRLLLPRDPEDDANLYLEVRAGTGGDEAALFAGDLFRMYQRHAERQGWSVEILSASPGEHGGFREVISRVAGEGAYGELKFESGTHRVQRVPATESQGRIHTSACTVAILPEREEVEAINIDPAELRVDTFRSSGAGGQHVNTTDSAIRVTHLPSGIVVECQDERSQHKNRARAMALLQARLLDAERSRQAAAEAQERKLQVGSGDRSQRIRTYNFPQGRITDHRIGLTIHQLDDVLDGNLAPLLGPLAQEHQAERLAELES